MPSKHTDSTKQLLEEITNLCYASKTHYLFGKDLKEDREYIKGKIASLDWISELCYYYIKKDKELLSEFNQKLQETKNRLLPLYKTNPYKKAIYETICEIEERIGV